MTKLNQINSSWRDLYYKMKKKKKTIHLKIKPCSRCYRRRQRLPEPSSGLDRSRPAISGSLPSRSIRNVKPMRRSKHPNLAFWEVFYSVLVLRSSEVVAEKVYAKRKSQRQRCSIVVVHERIASCVLSSGGACSFFSPAWSWVPLCKGHVFIRPPSNLVGPRLHKMGPTSFGLNPTSDRLLKKKKKTTYFWSPSISLEFGSLIGRC